MVVLLCIIVGFKNIIRLCLCLVFDVFLNKCFKMGMLFNRGIFEIFFCMFLLIKLFSIMVLLLFIIMVVLILCLFIEIFIDVVLLMLEIFCLINSCIVLFLLI